jgi:hypothetical protein
VTRASRKPPRRGPLAWLLALLVGVAPSVARAASDDLAPSPAAAEMLKAMAEKGVISKEEYEDIYRRQAIYETEQREQERIPGWMRDWTVGGDARFRLERIDAGDLQLEEVLGGAGELEGGDDNVDLLNATAQGRRDRVRLRFRIGAEKRVAESYTVGFRLATSEQITEGSDFGQARGVDFSQDFTDYRSSNVTFGNWFEPKGIYLDRAYLRWNPEAAPTLALSIGKFANPFVSKDFSGDFMVWDHDINPEGVALQYRFEFLPEELWWDTAAGLFILDENGSITTDSDADGDGFVSPILPDLDDRDAFLWGVQTGFHWALGGGGDRLGVRGSFYDYQHLDARDAALLYDLGNGGDAIDDDPLFVFSSDCVNPPDLQTRCEDGGANGRIQQGVIDLYARLIPFGERFPITPFAQYTTLLSADTEDDGFGFGVDFGRPELVELTVMWAKLERNAAVSAFVDSDFFDGFTNTEGWYVSARRRINDFLTVRATYSSTRLAEESCELASEDVLLCDTTAVLPLIGLYRETSVDHRKRFQIDLTAEF